VPGLSGARASALAEAAVRADLVERVVRPALDDGATVVADRFLASPLVRFGVVADRTQAELDGSELESLASFATGRLRPDVSVLLDRAPTSVPAEADVPAGDDTAPIPLPGEEHLQVRRLLTRMAAAEPHRYVVVEADGTPDDVAARVLAALTTVLPAPLVPRGGPDGTTGSSTPSPSTTMSSAIRGPAPSLGAATAGAGAETPAVVRAAGEPDTSDGASAGTPAVGRAPGDRGPATAGPATAGPATAGPATDGAAAGSGAVTTVVDDGKIATSGADPAPARFWHRRRRS
jgi:dTMP kinase